MQLLKKLLSFISNVSKKMSIAFKPVTGILANTKSIKAKLIMAFIVPILLLIIQGIISYSNTSQTAARLSEQATIAAMESSGKYLDLLLKTVDNISGQLFSDIDIQEYLSREFSSSEYPEAVALKRKVDGKLITTATYNSDINNIMIISSNKNIRIVCSSCN